MSPSKVWTDRSRILAYRRCPRMRFIEYHMAGTGLVPARKSLALVVGGMAHTGLARMLEMAMTFGLSYPENLSIIEDDGVAAGLAAWDAYVAANGGVEVEAGERVWESQKEPANVTGGAVVSAELIDFNMPLGLGSDELRGFTPVHPLTDRATFDQYTQQEQRALLEGMLRAYARRRLRPLLEEYEVLEVEREGEWKLGELGGDGEIVDDGINPPFRSYPDGQGELWFASRPDALLLHRESGSLHLLSYKTTGAVDLRKLADIQHDDQGLSEGVEIERRLAKWWGEIDTAYYDYETWAWGKVGPTPRMYEWLKSLSSAPRIDAIRYEFLLKGERWKDKGLSAQVGFEARSQKSPLVKGYQYSGRDPLLQGTFCWAWDYEKPDGSGKGSLNWQNWKAQPIWQTYGVKEWIDLLDSGKAQQVGMAGDALEAQFYPPQLVYRGEDDLRDWVEEVEAQETRIATVIVSASSLLEHEKDPRRSWLNQHFPKNRSACEYPGRCAYADKDHGPCYGPAHARGVEAMLASGKYVRREPNHPREREGAAWQGQR